MSKWKKTTICCGFPSYYDCGVEFIGHSGYCVDCRKAHKADYNKRLYLSKNRAREELKKPVPLTPGKQIISGMFGTV